MHTISQVPWRLADAGRVLGGGAACLAVVVGHDEPVAVERADGGGDLGHGLRGRGRNWRKSTYSDTNGGACIECASDVTGVMVRDTTNRAGITLSVSGAAWTAFLSTLR